MTSTQEPVNPFRREELPQGFYRWLPGLALLTTYKREWLLKDIGAGIVLTTVLIPVGMGYAEATGLPPICGLYASMTALLLYAFLGQSRILILGPDSALVSLVAASILPLAAHDSARAVNLAAVLAIISGLLCILAGAARFGFITDLLSKPVRYGYLNAIALTLIVGQVSVLLGFHVGAPSIIEETKGIVSGILSQQVNTCALMIGLSSLVAMLCFKRWLPKFPGVLLVVFVATMAVTMFDLVAKTGLAVVGSLPQGLPSFRLPVVSLADFNSLLTGAIAIALVSFADMSVVSRTFAFRGGYEVDDNKELLALGAVNIVVGLFQGFSVTSSASRTPVAEAAGGKTQVTGVVGAFCIALLLIFAPSVLQNVPSAVLAAVVITACLTLVNISGVVHLYKVRPGEFVSSLACFFGVALLGVIQGIFIAIGLALFSFIWRAWRPYSAVLGRVNELKGYHDISRHPEARLIPGLVLFRWDAPLFFANARVFEESILQAVADSPTPVKRVVVEAEPVTDIDSTAATALAELETDLREAGIELCFAQMKGPVKDQLKLYGLFDKIGAENFFPTVGVAIDKYLETHNIEWHDWDEDKCCEHAPHSGSCPK